jgi:diguanylate cyclase (GGDEF)-like protein
MINGLQLLGRLSVVAASVAFVAALLMPGLVLALDPAKALQHYVRKRWSVEEGLPQITVLAITQDRQGYLWVGTQTGLARFDGATFTSFTAENQAGLPGLWIRALHADRQDRLWVGTYKGLALRRGEEFVTIPAVDAVQWPALDVTGIAEDPAGRIWVSTASGLFRLEAGALGFVDGSPVPATSVAMDGSDVLVGTIGGVARLSNGSWQRMGLGEPRTSLPVSRVLSFEGGAWATTPAGLFRSSGGALEPFALSTLTSIPLDMLFADSTGTLWVGGDGGLARIRAGRVIEVVPAASAGGIPGLRSAYEDREGNVWLGSQWESLFRISRSWTRRFGVSEGLNHRIVWSVAPGRDPGSVWVGGNDGLSLLQDGRVRLVVPSQQLPHPVVYNLLAEDDRLWIGTRRGLVVAQVNSEGIANIVPMPSVAPLASAQINGFLREGSSLWIASSDGLYRLDGPHLKRVGEPEGLDEHHVRYIARLRGGELLAGTSRGLYRRTNGRFIKEVGKGLPADLDVSLVHELRDGSLLISSVGEKTYYGRNGRWILLDRTAGIPTNAGVFATEAGGYLWLAGIRGVTRVPLGDLERLADGDVQRVRGEMVLSDRGDPMSGQPGYCCNGAGTAKGFFDGDSLWLPSRDGVVALDIGDIRRNSVRPVAVIEGIHQRGAHAVTSPAGAVHLPEGARDLTFDFTVLSLTDPKSTRIEYRLAGYDPHWLRADAFDRQANYTNLPAGSYRFEVRGANNSGLQTAQPARVDIVVPPYFRETRSFAVLCGALAALLVYVGYLFQRRHYRGRQRQLEALVEQRTEALRELNDQLEQASLTDPLTRLRNRRYLASQIPADIAYYFRDHRALTGDQAMVFALVDLDHFKAINDTYGHQAGDAVLRQVADILGSLVRTGDYVARWGGEEFLVVFRPMQLQHASDIGRRICNAVAGHPFDIGTEQRLSITCSVGLTYYAAGTRVNSWEDCVNYADVALYRVKSRGRNGWSLQVPERSFYEAQV